MFGAEIISSGNEAGSNGHAKKKKKKKVKKQVQQSIQSDQESEIQKRLDQAKKETEMLLGPNGFDDNTKRQA